MYDDKQSILDHVRYHKLHHYNIKFDETKREILDYIPQVLTVPSQYDDITINFGENSLGFQIKDKEEEKLFFDFIMKYIIEKHPEHAVRK